MNLIAKLTSLLISLLLLIPNSTSVELTFELPDNSKECFYQDIGKNKTAILEYQVKILENKSQGENFADESF